MFICGCFWEIPESSPNYLPLDDSVYPYANVPRVVIETENFRELRDRETEFSSYLQVYGDSVPETKVLHLTVRGRGNSSFKMPKYGMKLEFDEKISLLGMNKNKDWVLIANYGDKTHLRNFMMTRISEWLSANYTPKMKFVELYLNRKYMGLYLLSESIKVSKNRVNIKKNDTSFLIERENENKIDSPYVTTRMNNMFHIKYPKNITEDSKNLLLKHLNDFEKYLYSIEWMEDNNVKGWVDIEDFLIYYWVQEFSKNEDGNFMRSIFMTWENGGVIRFGPLWDFDLGFGNASYEQNKSFDRWYIRLNNWNYYLFKDKIVSEKASEFWRENRHYFKALIDSIPIYKNNIIKVIDNEYKRWPIIQNTENWALKDPYDTYDEAIQSMIDWMNKRYEWIDNNYK